MWYFLFKLEEGKISQWVCFFFFHFIAQPPPQVFHYGWSSWHFKLGQYTQSAGPINFPQEGTKVVACGAWRVNKHSKGIPQVWSRWFLYSGTFSLRQWHQWRPLPDQWSEGKQLMMEGHVSTHWCVPVCVSHTWSDRMWHFWFFFYRSSFFFPPESCVKC